MSQGFEANHNPTRIESIVIATFVLLLFPEISGLDIAVAIRNSGNAFRVFLINQFLVQPSSLDISG